MLYPGWFTLLLCGALSGACGTKHDMTGTLTVRMGVGDKVFAYKIDQPCVGDTINSDYADLHPGGSVTVKNGQGAIIAKGEITDGTWTKLACRLRFSVSQVPDADFYVIAVGNHAGPTYSRTDMERNKWTINVTLGESD